MYFSVFIMSCFPNYFNGNGSIIVSKNIEFFEKNPHANHWEFRYKIWEKGESTENLRNNCRNDPGRKEKTKTDTIRQLKKIIQKKGEDYKESNSESSWCHHLIVGSKTHAPSIADGEHNQNNNRTEPE